MSEQEIQTQNAEAVIATPPVANAQPEQTTQVENPPAEESKQKEEENRIPISRVKEMLAKAKEEARKEKIAVRDTEIPQQQETPDEFRKSQDYVKMLIQSEIEPFKAQLELDKTISKYPDLPKFKDEMASLIKQNPNLSYEEAYKLSKFDSLHQLSYENGKKEAIQNIQAKKSASVETQKVKNAPKLDLDNLNIMDKSVSLRDIEKLLPHS